MILFFLFLTGITAVLYVISSRRYEKAEEVYRMSRDIFRPFLPVGLLIQDTLKYGYSTSYDRRLLATLCGIYGGRQAILQLRLYWSKKIILLLAGVLFSSLIGAFTRPDGGYAVFCVLLLASVFWLPDRDLYERLKKRRLEMQLEFPDFVNKLTLLINAGLSVAKAWERISTASSKQTPLYVELRLTLQDLRSGKPEHRAYEEFAKRCRIHEITRFITVILQNVRKGNNELVPILRVFADDCWELRKNTAKRCGEEASTKMLLPMMLMFTAVLLIVGTPAVLALGSI